MRQYKTFYTVSFKLAFLLTVCVVGSRSSKPASSFPLSLGYLHSQNRSPKWGLRFAVAAFVLVSLVSLGCFFLGGGGNLNPVLCELTKTKIPERWRLLLEHSGGSCSHWISTPTFLTTGQCWILHHQVPKHSSTTRVCEHPNTAVTRSLLFPDPVSHRLSPRHLHPPLINNAVQSGPTAPTHPNGASTLQITSPKRTRPGQTSITKQSVN